MGLDRKLSTDCLRKTILKLLKVDWTYLNHSYKSDLTYEISCKIVDHCQLKRQVTRVE